MELSANLQEMSFTKRVVVGVGALALSVAVAGCGHFGIGGDKKANAKASQAPGISASSIPDASGAPETSASSGAVAPEPVTNFPTLSRKSPHTPTNAALIETEQQTLVAIGCKLGTSGPNNDGVDTYFGVITEQAITTFQTNVGLNPDGKDGTDTHNKLLEAQAAGQTNCGKAA